ncbi:MAG TPA: YdcF family protein [Burkholderiaceae bacterium]
MNWNIFIANLVSAFFLPPLGLIALCVVGYFLRKKWPRFGMALSAGSLLILVAISTPAGALLLVRPLEELNAPLISTHHTGAQAIVVLGGGQIVGAPEYGGLSVPNAITLIRLRYAAKLYIDTGLPILVTGGAPTGAPQSEAAQMARVLREDFSTPVKWLEEASNDTAQNAQYSARILQPVGVQRILLVTDAMHMARAKSIFVRNGFDVVAAPTQFLSRRWRNLSPYDFMPGGSALYHASYAMHEWIGMAWYWLRY